MIPKALANIACLAFSVLIAFACNTTPESTRVPAPGANDHKAAPQAQAPAAQDALADPMPMRAAGDSCSDSIANCGDPVKHLGTQNDCACFACGYGTPGQRTVCTRNPADKKALFSRSK